MLARDGKGQAAASREIAIRIAINSYDRQLKLARSAFTGRQDMRDLATCGYASLDRHEGRLAQLKTLAGKMVLLKETLADQAKPGANDAIVLKDIRYSLHVVQPSFDYVRMGWDGGMFDWISSARLPARLQTVVRDAVCGSELALNAPALRSAVEQALAAENPKAALGALAPTVEANIKTQEDLAKRLGASHRMIQVELAGYLAATLDARLERATPADWGNNDFVLAARASASELSELLAADVGPYAAAVSNATFQSALADKDARAALERVKPLLQPLATNLADAAFAMAVDAGARALPLAAYAEANRPVSNAWMDIYAAWLVMQSGSPGSDPVATLQDSMRFLQFYGGGDGAFRPVGDGNPAVRDRQETAFRAAMTAARMRADAESLRVGLMAGYLAPGKPELESLWISLREGYLDLARLKDQPALDAGVRNELASLTAGRLAPLKQWVAAERDPGRLAATARDWEAAMQALALRTLPEAQNTLRSLDADIASRWPALQAGAGAISRDIGVRVAALERFQATTATNASPWLVFYPARTLQIRHQAAEQALLSMLDVAEACRLHTGGGAADLDRLTLARSYVSKASEYIRNPLLNLQNTIGREKEFRGTVMTGKIKEYRELDRIVGEFGALAAAAQAPDEVVRRLKENMLAIGHERERVLLRLALGMEASLADKTNLVRAVASDRTAAAAVWGPVCQDVVLLKDTIQDGKDLGGVKARVEGTLAVVRLLDPLPKDLQAVPDILAGCAGDLGPAARRQQAADDLAGVLDDLRPLAQPPPAPLGREQAQADLLAVNRARIALAAGAAGLSRLPLAWAVSEMEWNRRKVRVAEGRLAIGGLALGTGDELENLRLPKHLYLELKRAREHAMPDLFRDRCYKYLNDLMEAAR